MSRTFVAEVMAAAALLAFASNASCEPAAVIEARVSVDSRAPGPIIDRHIFGQFAEHLGRGIYGGVWVGENSPIPNTHGLRNDVIAALRDLHVPDVRWPGGCFADEYHWRDGIGPAASRPARTNSNWGGVPDSNAFGTHEFLEFAQLIGADAYINGNLRTGSPAEMSDWLQYMTSDQPGALTAERARNGHPQPWKISYIAVGNEAWGCGGNMTPEHYVDLFRSYAGALKAPPGQGPMILASGGYKEDTSWTETLISKMSREIDAITFHYYTTPSGNWEAKGPATGFGEDQWISTLAHTLRMDDFIARNSAIMDKYDPEKKVALAVDEWGTAYDPEPGPDEGLLYQQNTLRDAVAAALNFNIFQAHADRVRMANISQMVNVMQAMILTDGSGMILTPTYYVFQMYRPFQDARLLPFVLDAPQYHAGKFSVPAVSMSAALTQDHKIVIALVNLDPNEARPISTILTGAPASAVTGEILTAGAMDAHNTFENPDAIRPKPFTGAALHGNALSLVLPAKSVVVLTLQ